MPTEGPDTATKAAPRYERPASSAEHELYLGLLRLANALGQQSADLLKESGLSGAQYNVLRILRGAGEGGLACGEIGERLLTRDPDITRLLDRLARQGLISRSRDETDRRVVTTRITRAGLDLLATLDEPMAALHRRQLGGLGHERIARFQELVAATLATL